MQVSNDWPMDEPFGGPGLSPCVVAICEHSVELYECEICLETQPIFKKKSKLKIVGLVFLTPLYLLGSLAYGVVTFFRFLAGGGLFGLIIARMDHFCDLPFFLCIYSIYF